MSAAGLEKLDPKVAVGDRVVVAIKDPTKFAYRAAEAMNGATGVVEKIGAISHGPSACLVAFDQPVNTWWTGGSPSIGFWFDPGDLAVSR